MMSGCGCISGSCGLCCPPSCLRCGAPIGGDEQLYQVHPNWWRCATCGDWYPKPTNKREGDDE
jgi:hypothetical protein